MKGTREIHVLYFFPHAGDGFLCYLVMRERRVVYGKHP